MINLVIPAKGPGSAPSQLNGCSADITQPIHLPCNHRAGRTRQTDLWMFACHLTSPVMVAGII